LVLLILALAAVAFAETNLTGSPGPAAPYVERHSALDKYPFKNDGGDQLNWADFGLKGRVRKMYIETSDVIIGTDSLKDHVIVSFDSLGRVETTFSDTYSPQPRGFRYLYRPDGQLEKVQRCACQNGLETQTAALDSVYPAQDNAAEYFYDELGKLNRIVFYDDAGAVFKEHLYTYTDDGYSVAINFAVPSRRNRDQIHFYDRKGTPVISQKKRPQRQIHHHRQIQLRHQEGHYLHPPGLSQRRPHPENHECPGRRGTSERKHDKRLSG